jgi:hypothetical protein
MFVVHDLSLGGFVARVTRQVPYMEHELLTLVKHMCSRLGLGRVPVARSLVFCVMLLFVLFRLVIVCPNNNVSSEKYFKKGGKFKNSLTSITRKNINVGEV